MQLHKIVMENFRGYNGEHTIEFSGGDKNITLVLGENNAGKTGIYRALIFGLYGDRILAQDSSSRKVHLVNFKALNEGELVKTTVKIVISDSKGEYTITRSLKAIIDRGNYIEDENEELNFDFKDLEGETYKGHIDDKENIQDYINNILDENIKEFFLFDGEKIETLARAGNESRKEVKNGIIKLMQIDRLDKAKQVIRKLKDNERTNITAKSSNNKLGNIEKNIEELNIKIKSSLEQKKEYEMNLKDINKEIEKIELELSKSEDIRKILNDKEMYMKDLQSIELNIKNEKNNLEEYHFKQGASTILNDYFIKSNNHLEHELLKQDDVISIHVIEETLKKGICLCCNQEVINNEESIAFLNKIKKNYKSSNVTRLMDMISRESKESIRSKENRLKKIETILRKIRELEEEKRNINSEIGKIEQIISLEDRNKDNFKNEENRHIKLLSDKKSDEQSIYNLEELIKKHNKELKKLNIEYSKLLKEDKSLNYEMKRLEMLTGLDEKLNNLYEKYIDMTRKQLGEETTKTFKELIDYQEMSLVENIVISDRYEIDIKDTDGKDVTQDISQGQQVIVALSFITSLARIVSKSKDKVDYPLFMDTPFANLGRENRRNLIESLPKLTRQWIPLLTDTEYTDFEKNIFKKTNKIGKVYKIKKINKEESEIVEIKQ